MSTGKEYRVRRERTVGCRSGDASVSARRDEGIVKHLPNRSSTICARAVQRAASVSRGAGRVKRTAKRITVCSIARYGRRQHCVSGTARRGQ